MRAAPSVFSLDAGQTAIGGYEPGKTSAQAAVDCTAYAAALAHPLWQGLFDPVPLLDARNAGVLGVVVTWTGLPDDEVINQYNPFLTGYPAASGLRPRRSGLPRGMGRRLDRHRAVRARGERDARAHRGHHRRCGDRDGLGLAERRGGHRREQGWRSGVGVADRQDVFVAVQADLRFVLRRRRLTGCVPARRAGRPPGADPPEHRRRRGGRRVRAAGLDAAVAAAELTQYARQHLAAHKYPRQITIVPAVPLTSAGKLDRKKLRTWTG